MSKLNIEELLAGLLEASIIAQRVSEKQHIENISVYFDKSGNPITKTFKIGNSNLEVPLFILANHSSLAIDELDIEFDARMLIGESNMSGLKRRFLGDDLSHNTNLSGDEIKGIKSIQIDSGMNTEGSSLAKIKVKFKSESKPEMVSRLMDSYIQTCDKKPE